MAVAQSASQSDRRVQTVTRLSDSKDVGPPAVAQLPRLWLQRLNRTTGG